MEYAMIAEWVEASGCPIAMIVVLWLLWKFIGPKASIWKDKD